MHGPARTPSLALARQGVVGERPFLLWPTLSELPRAPLPSPETATPPPTVSQADRAVSEVPAFPKSTPTGPEGRQALKGNPEPRNSRARGQKGCVLPH